MAGYWYSGDKQALLGRLRRIEGQIRGLERMVEQDTYCIDILTQISAATRALQSVALNLLDGHLSHCVAEATAQGGETADGEGQGSLRGDRPAGAFLTRRPTDRRRDMSTQTFTVTGMTCEHCVNAVTEEISSLGGVEAVRIDLASGQVAVDSATPLDTGAVRAAVDEAGYQLG